MPTTPQHNGEQEEREEEIQSQIDYIVGGLMSHHSAGKKEVRLRTRKVIANCEKAAIKRFIEEYRKEVGNTKKIIKLLKNDTTENALELLADTFWASLYEAEQKLYPL